MLITTRYDYQISSKKKLKCAKNIYNFHTHIWKLTKSQGGNIESSAINNCST